MDIYGRDDAESTTSPHAILPPEHLGSCYVLPNHLKSTEGRMQTPILSTR